VRLQTLQPLFAHRHGSAYRWRTICHELISVIPVWFIAGSSIHPASEHASVLTGILSHLSGFICVDGILIAPLSPVIAFRFLIDWNRKYRELWLDREKPPS
jgi:hypothetical protein